MSRLHKRPLGVRMLQGIAVAVWVALFWYLVRLIGWGRRLSPGAAAPLFLTLAVAGAAGGGAYYATDGLRAAGGTRGTLANLLTVTVFSVVAFTCLALVARWL